MNSKFFGAVILGCALSASALAQIQLEFNQKSKILPLKKTTGELTFSARFDRDQRDCWYWINFLKADGKPAISVRIDPDKLIYYTAEKKDGPFVASTAYSYKNPLKMREYMNVTVKAIDGRFYQTSINGQDLPNVTAGSGDITGVQLAAHNCKITYDKLKWTEQESLPLNLQLFGNTGIHSQKYLELPKGDFELSFRFQAEFRGGDRTHYGVEIEPADGNMQERVQLVFWDNGFQMIQGKNSKWLGNFNKEEFNGKEHEFRLKRSDADFYEVYIDGKLVNNFEALVPADSQFKFWSYGKWFVELNGITLKSEK